MVRGWHGCQCCNELQPRGERRGPGLKTLQDGIAYFSLIERGDFLASSSFREIACAREMPCPARRSRAIVRRATMGNWPLQSAPKLGVSAPWQLHLADA